MPLRTALTNMLGIEHPIIQGGVACCAEALRLQTFLSLDIGAPDEACNMLGMQKWQPLFPMCLGLKPKTQPNKSAHPRAHTHTCDECQNVSTLCEINFVASHDKTHPSIVYPSCFGLYWAVAVALQRV